ncbi:hypothetical protein [Gloeothece verrucosa]|uniref:Uncharacterized protein n=1 Tax=Gloeothece verrucosa (strain PCC 7822) TaxID=497965 RepID=E0UD12_GLOV7|nr:hypothetical protein [Gloeothece verrucosa]ADN16477.1 hypothetical protein Cyan7822_4568 [Gloeothece verrucosa PCC 7822]
MTQTLCSGAGIWEVKADVPIPPKIRFNWNDGTGWQEKAPATDYTIFLRPKDQGKDGEYYDVYLSYAPNGADCPNLVYFAFVDKYMGRLRAPFGIGFGPEYYSNHRCCDDSRFSAFPNYQNYSVRILYFHHKDGSNSLIYAATDIPLSALAAFKIIDLNGKVFPPQIEYNLKIYNSKTLIYDQTNTTNPLVEKISESCQFTGEYTSVYSEVNLNPSAFLTSEIVDGKTVILKKCVGAVQNNQISSSCSQVAAVSGSCAAPKIKASQEPLCPPGTCELLCGGCLCCYNDLGYSVKSYCEGIV